MFCVCARGCDGLSFLGTRTCCKLYLNTGVEYVNGVWAHVQTSAANLQHTAKQLPVRQQICQIRIF